MRKVDPLWFKLIADVLTNLCAGWIGVAIATSFASKLEPLIRVGLLTANLVAAIVSLIVAFILNKKGSRKGKT